MSLDPHHVAILALLQAPGALPAPIVAYTDAIPNGTLPPYVRVFLSVSYPGMEDLTNKSNRAVARAVCHCAGGSTDAADVVANAVRAALLDVVPTIAGRACFPIRNESTVGPRPDETTGVLVMDTVDVYRLESVPG